MPRNFKPCSQFGEITIVRLPNDLIKRLNRVAKQNAPTRQSFLKTEIFKLVERFEAENKIRDNSIIKRVGGFIDEEGRIYKVDEKAFIIGQFKDEGK